MFVAISACRKENHYVINLRNTLELIETVEDMGFAYTVATGVYDGVEEDSVIVSFAKHDVSHVLENLSMLMTRYNQECLLLVDVSGVGTLLFANGDTAHAGVWREVSQAELVATKADHTRLPDGRVYVCN